MIFEKKKRRELIGHLDIDVYKSKVNLYARHKALKTLFFLE